MNTTRSIVKWSDYFDQIYCVHYLPYKDRLLMVTNELEKVGILNSGIFRFKYTYHTKFDTYVRQNIRSSDPSFSSGPRMNLCISLTLAYYRMFKESLALKYSHIAMLEDDVVFTDDIQTIASTLSNMPCGWDYIHFDKMLNKGFAHLLNQGVQVNDYFNTYSGGYWGTAFTAFSSKAMSCFCDIIEQELLITDHVLENHNADRVSDLNRFVPSTFVCYQRFKYDYYTKLYIC